MEYSGLMTYLDKFFNKSDAMLEKVLFMSHQIDPVQIYKNIAENHDESMFEQTKVVLKRAKTVGEFTSWREDLVKSLKEFDSMCKNGRT